MREQTEPQTSRGHHYDVVVVGAGSSGCALAAYLAANTELSIGLVEAGPDYGPYAAGQWPGELLDPRRFPVTHDWGFSEERSAGEERAEPRARTVGGCSAHNQCAAVWGAPEDYDAWAAVGNSGWSHAELDPVLDEVEATLQPQTDRDADLAGWQRAFIKAALDAGFAKDELPGRTAQAGVVGAFPATVRHGVRWHAGFAFLDPVRDRLRILDRLIADRLLIESGRASALLCRSGAAERIELAADRFVLAAGVYGSPAILLRSGIGPRDELRRIGIRPELAIEGVGRNLHDHPGVAVRFEPSAAGREQVEADRRSGRLYQSQVIAKAAADGVGSRVDLHLLPYQAPTDSGDWRFEVLSFAMRPRSRGYVTLRSADPTEAPKIDFRFLTDPDREDERILARGVQLVRDIATSSPLRELVSGELEPGLSGIDPGKLLHYVRDAVTGYGHAVGTCRMGPAGDPGTVVDHSGRVHGTDNLFVADASIMPDIPAANTNLTCYVVGRRMAAILAR